MPSGDCVLLNKLWSYIWDPKSGKYYVPNVLQNGLSIGGTNIPSLASVSIGDLPAISLFTEKALGSLSITLKGTQLAGLPNVQKGSYSCDDSNASVTKLAFTLIFGQLNFSGSYDVMATGVTGCALGSAAFFLGGGLADALPLGLAAAGDGDVEAQLNLARFYRDGPLQTNPDGSANQNGQLMAGTYYLHQDTVNEIISDAGNQNVRSALTATSAGQMSQQITLAAQSYKDNPAQQQPLPGQPGAAFNVNNSIAVVCMQKISGGQDRDGRYSALLTDQTRFYQSVVWAKRNQPQDVTNVGGVLGVVRTTSPVQATQGSGSAQIHRIASRMMLVESTGMPPAGSVPEKAMPVYDPQTREIFAFVTLDGPVLARTPPNRSRFGAPLVDLPGTFLDGFSNVSASVAASVTATGSTITVKVTSLLVQLPAVDIKLTYSGGGWDPSLFEKVENAVANSNALKNMLTAKISGELGGQHVLDTLSQYLTTAANNFVGASQ